VITFSKDPLLKAILKVEGADFEEEFILKEGKDFADKKCHYFLAQFY